MEEKTARTGDPWGDNWYGQVGDGTTTSRGLPQQAVNVTDVIAVSAGGYHTIALKSDGTVWAWGDNSQGQLGDGTTTDSPVRVRVGTLTGVTTISAGSYHNLALQSDGTVWAWGRNFSGQLGAASADTCAGDPCSKTPIQSGIANVGQIAAGGFQSYAIKSDDTLWAWGNGANGELGDGTNTSKRDPVQVTSIGTVTTVAGGVWHGLATKSDGSAWSWGWNGTGQLGDGTTTSRNIPAAISGFSGVSRMAGSGWHSLAVKTDETLWAFGSNANGELGDDTTTDRLSPVQVKGPDGSGFLTSVTSASAGYDHSVARKTDGTIWAWGYNYHGAAGDGSRWQRNAPVQVHGAGDIGFLTAGTVVAGGGHSVALKDGSVWGWGYDFDGALGLGTTADRSTPKTAIGVTDPTAVSAGGHHSLVLRSDGVVLAFGLNDRGQLGDGTLTDRSTAIEVPGLTGITAIAAGSDHSLALKSDGTVWAWGRGNSGQLGDGAATDRSSPVQVSGLASVSSIAAGALHSFAIKSDGTVWAWGYNFYGQLGDGTTTQRNQPVGITSLAGATAVAGGLWHSLAIKADGTVWAWGYNGDGQLGDGSTTQRTSPVRSGTLTAITAVAGGGYHSAARMSDGSAWSWGNNYSGQLGDGTRTRRLSPVQMSGVAEATSVSAGAYHTVVLKSDGTVWSTGMNLSGQLGDGTNNRRTSVVQVLGLTGVDATDAGAHHTLVMPPAAAPGALPVEGIPAGTDRAAPLVNGAFTGISVVSSTGALSLSFSDFTISGRGPAPVMTRTYNSNDTRSGPLGPGWTHSYDMRLVDPGDQSGAVILVGPQGRRDRFTSSGGTFTAPAGVFTTLVQNGDGTYTATAKDQSAADFDGNGRLARLKDRYGNVSSLTYDGAKRLQSVGDPAGRGVLSFAYDLSGRLVNVSDWIGRAVQFAYDQNGRLGRATDREASATTFTYDGGGRLASVTDARGNTALTVTYDVQGRVQTQKDAKGLASGQQTDISYGASTTTATLPASSFDGYRGIVTDTFDANGWLTRREAKPTAAETSVAQYAYDASGNLTSATDPRGNATTFCYDVDYAGAAVAGSRGNLTRVIAPAPVPQNPYVSLLKYDGKNNVIESVSPRGVANGSTVTCTTNLTAAVNAQFVVTFTYDATRTKLLSTTTRFTDPETGAQTAITKLEYTDGANPGRVTKVIPPRGNTGQSPDYTFATTLSYFATGAQAGMLERVTDAMGNVTTYAYDTVGRRTSMVDQRGNAPGGVPAEHSWTYTYDREDRLTASSAPAPAAGGAALQRQNRYDAVGNRTVTIDANGQVTTFLYDERNLLAEVQESPSVWTDPAVTPSPLYRTTHAYDHLGSLTRVTRAAGDSLNERVTDTLFDGFGRARQEIQYPSWPLTTGLLVTTYGYDASSNPITVNDPLAKTTTLGYDSLDRLTSLSYSDGTPGVTYGYDANGGRTSMQDGSGTTTYTLDELGRATALTTPGPKTVGYRYDLDGNRRKIVYSDATAVTYTHDRSSRLTSLLDWASRSTSYTYNPDSTVQQVTGVNGTSASYSYDNARRLTLVSQSQASTLISQHRYTLDAVGNRTRSEDLLGQVGGSSPAAWGKNSFGGLGDGTLVDRDRPVTINGLGTASMLAGGHHHSLALKPDRTVRGWGRNTYGAVGDGTNEDRLTPVSVTGLSNVIQVNAGDDHSVALLEDGTVKTWGRNTFGQLGDGSFTHRSTPVTVTGVSVASQISAAWNHTLALKSDGAVWSWGLNDFGQLGDGSTTDRTSPVQVKGVGGVGFLTDIVQVVGARYHSLALKSDGTVYAWGKNHHGQLGDGTLQTSTTPIVVKGPGGIGILGGVASIAAAEGEGLGGGSGYSMALMTDGTVWGWGDNTFGQLGDGTTTTRAFPIQVGGSTFTGIKAIATGLWTGLALKTDGTVWTWGQHTFGQLGRDSSTMCGTDPCSLSPGQVVGLSRVTGIFGSGLHHLVAATVNQPITYSYDRLYRLLGDGSTTYAYDSVGNRTSMSGGGGTTNYSYDRADRITAAGAVTYSMNAAGNLTARGSDSFAFDGANRLTGSTVGGTTTTYAYDGDGTRRSKATGAQTTNYVFDQARGLPALLEDGTRKYVWGLGLAFSAEGASVAAVHSDGLLSVRALSDGAGALTDTFQRDAFGVRGAVEGQSTQPFDFTGELRDGETGFIYLRARMYDPFTGRFISRDPLAGLARAPTTLNRYSYAGNNPVNRRDPSGRAFIADDPSGSCATPVSTDPISCVGPAPAPTTTSGPTLDPGSSSTLTTAAAAPAPIAPTSCTGLLCSAVQAVLFGAGSSVGVSGDVVVAQNVSGTSLYGAIPAVLGADAVVVRGDLIVSRISFGSGDELHRHEFGHIEQARLLGARYLPEYLGEFFRLRAHHSMEINANVRAGLAPYWPR